MPRTPTTNYLFRHRRGFKYRRAVPHDLRGLLGKAHWVKTFPGTVSYEEAKAACRVLAVEHDRLIKGLRAATQTQREAIADAGGWEAFKTLPDALERGLPYVETVAVHFEDDPGVSPEGAAEIVDARRIAKRMRAEIAATRQVVTKIGAPAKGEGLAALIPLWLSISKPGADKTVQRMHLHIGRCMEIIGRKAPAEITRQDCVALRDSAEAAFPRPVAAKMLEAANTLFNVGMKKGTLAANPMQGLKVLAKPDDKEGREPFKTDQAKLVFRQMVIDLPVSFQWVIRLCAYHGMRSGEASQLRPADITTSHGGIPVMLIHRRDGKSVKNDPSQREVPIHPECMDVVAYAHARKAQWLFDLPPKGGRERATHFQRKASVWLDKIGITDDRYTMHSWRHRWRALAYEADMPDSVVCTIGGWKRKGGEQANYGGRVSLKTCATWVAKVDPLA